MWLWNAWTCTCETGRLACCWVFPAVGKINFKGFYSLILQHKRFCVGITVMTLFASLYFVLLVLWFIGFAAGGDQAHLSRQRNSSAEIASCCRAARCGACVFLTIWLTLCTSSNSSWMSKSRLTISRLRWRKTSRTWQKLTGSFRRTSRKVDVDAIISELFAYISKVFSKDVLKSLDDSQTDLKKDSKKDFLKDLNES